MLELQRIRENRDEVVERLAVKNFDAAALVDEIINLDRQRRAVQKKLDDTLALSKKRSKEIAQYFKTGERKKPKQPVRSRWR